MIKEIIELLNSSKHYGVSERVEIAKGKYELPNGWKHSFEKIKRHSKNNKSPITWGDIWIKLKTHKWWKRK
jgi:hypothetical protein